MPRLHALPFAILLADHPRGGTAKLSWDAARSYLLRILDEFGPQIRVGIPVVMLEPSCASVFWDELINLLPNDQRAIRLSEQTIMLSEALVQSSADWHPPRLRRPF